MKLYVLWLSMLLGLSTAGVMRLRVVRANRTQMALAEEDLEEDQDDDDEEGGEPSVNGEEATTLLKQGAHHESQDAQALSYSFRRRRSYTRHHYRGHHYTPRRRRSYRHHHPHHHNNTHQAAAPVVVTTSVAPLATHTDTECHPSCKWACTDPACEQTCHPTCHAPACKTYCKPVNTATCHTVCNDPQCTVICPKSCVDGHCPRCRTVCGPPNCHTSCNQECESKCAEPICTWQCSKPTVCAKPVCNLDCRGSAGCDQEATDVPSPTSGFNQVGSNFEGSLGNTPPLGSVPGLATALHFRPGPQFGPYGNTTVGENAKPYQNNQCVFGPPKSGTYLRGNNMASGTAVAGIALSGKDTIRQCMNACCQTVGCKSFDINLKQGRCFPNDLAQKDAPSQMVTGQPPEVYYFELLHRR
mmetsp:Transcript_41219/g.89845  ORF Transcript_41219/g.89845 Transcript_41219/m.89845 type:complete len:414 (-) Transcript_41219:32-1273(-)